MRGKAGNAQVYGDARGITPAYAGKRMQTIRLGVPCGDHPRLCGEKPHTAAQRRSDGGSPPPMRGKG